MAAVGSAVACVVAVVASLAQCPQVARIIIGRVMIEVGDGQNDIDGVRRACAGEGRPPCVVPDTAELTAVMSSLEDPGSDLPPVLWIEMSQLFLDGHSLPVYWFKLAWMIYIHALILFRVTIHTVGAACCLCVCRPGNQSPCREIFFVFSRIHINVSLVIYS